MADRSKVIFGNQMSAKDYKKALEKKKSYLRISGFSHSSSLCLFIFVIYQTNVSAHPGTEGKRLI